MISLAEVCPFPTVGPDGSLQPGTTVDQPVVCARCSERACAAQPVVSVLEPTHELCPKGMSVVRMGKMTINGLIVYPNNTVCPQGIRKQSPGNKVSWQECESWLRGSRSVSEAFRSVVEASVRDALAGLHDVKAVVNLVSRNSEALASQFPGDTDDERVDGAPPLYKALFKSIELLRSILSFSSIVANPASAAFGRKRPQPIYRIFHRMVKIFEQEAGQRGVTLRMRGGSYAMPLCHDSFESVALILLDNAVKYSLHGREVQVVVEDAPATVDVKVESYGPVVPVGMRDKIFDKRVRTDEAVRMASGSGLGLYVARIIAEAHGFAIRYDASDGTLGRNCFSFSVQR